MSPTIFPTPSIDPCICDAEKEGSVCIYGDPRTTSWPHVGRCSVFNSPCDCEVCPPARGKPKQCLPPTPSPTSSPPEFSPLEIGIAALIVLLLVACIIFSICFFGLRKLRANIASHSSATATSLEDPLLFSTSSINGSIVNSIEVGTFSAAAADTTPPPLPPSQKKKARADTSHLASARIDPADLSPFLDDADEPILLGRGGFGAVFLAHFHSHDDDVVAVR